MAQRLRTTTADVVIAFQQNPGVDKDSIIDAGDAVTDGDVTVRPVRGGYYGLVFPDDARDDARLLRLFNTDYTVHLKPKNLTGHDPDTRTIVAWEDLWDLQDPHKVQHMLHLLGYYRGSIQGILERDVEEALLAFQADNSLRTGGLEWLRSWAAGPAAPLDAQAVTKIQEVVDDKNKVTKQGSNEGVYLIRKTLLHFTRAPVINAASDYWPANKEAPEIDDRGFVRAKANGHRCRGPVVSMVYEAAGTDGNPGCQFHVTVIRDGLDDNVTLVAESEEPDRVSMDADNLSVATVNLDDAHTMNLVMRTGDPGRKSRKVRVYIKWRKNVNELITVATLRVIIMPMKTVQVQPWLVGIKANILDPASELPQVSGHDMTDGDLLTVFEAVNNIWFPYGINFIPRSVNNHDFQAHLKVVDRVSKLAPGGNLDPVNGRLRPEQTRIFRPWVRGGQPVAGRAPKNAINLYIVKDIEGAFGSTISPFTARSGAKTGILLKNRAEGLTRTGETLAHELGHFLGLANNHASQSNRRSHTEEDPDRTPANRRKDMWAIRRLMLGTAPEVLAPNRTWAWDNGYWHTGSNDPTIRGKIRGNMLSLRNLSNDLTDDECRNARKQTKPSKVYG